MVDFQLEAWSAMASDLRSKEEWDVWFDDPKKLEEPSGKISLKQIPAMLRRRFSKPGKYALAAALPLLQEEENLPSVFSSRHGDIEQTLALLEGIGRDDEMSPTGFSLAVHNAISGLFSIARKDTSEVVSISASKGLIIQTLFEAIGQMQNAARVLCVIYDVPLPEPYSRSTNGDAFPFAIAMILNRNEGESYRIDVCKQADLNVDTALPADLNTEALRFIEFLSRKKSYVTSSLHGRYWRVSKTEVGE